MKLIDILVEELPKCGGWDAKWHQCAQDGNGEVCFFTSGEIHFREIFDAWSIPSDSVSRHDGKARLEALLADDYSETIITREQYEAALAAKNDGWIDWGGGNCPVEKGTLIDVKHRDGEIYQNKPAMGDNNTRWSHTGSRGDIISYRLHKPQEAEQAKADEEADLNECIGQDAAPVWSGEGLPPVGMEIEYKFTKVNYRTDFSRGKVLAYGMHNVFMEHWASKNEFIQPLDKIEFRPIRSEADRKRDEAVQALCDAGGGNGKVDEKSGYGSCWFDIYDAIAAGKIPGVKLDD